MVMAETLPPLTLDGLRDALRNPNFRSYVYIGNESDTGWKLAISAQRMLPSLRVYCAKPSEANAVLAMFNVPADRVGIVFGWGDVPKRMLSAAEAADFYTLTQAIQDASA